jgi:CBS domain-containing protein
MPAAMAVRTVTIDSPSSVGRWNVKVSDVYRPAIDTCPPTENLGDAASRMVQADTGALAIVDRARLLGVITERDLVRAVADGAEPTRVPVITYARTGVLTASLDEDVAAVARRMLDAGVRRMPVLGLTGELVGMVSMRDLLAVETLA